MHMGSCPLLEPSLLDAVPSTPAVLDVESTPTVVALEEPLVLGASDVAGGAPLLAVVPAVPAAVPAVPAVPAVMAVPPSSPHPPRLTTSAEASTGCAVLGRIIGLRQGTARLPRERVSRRGSSRGGHGLDERSGGSALRRGALGRDRRSMMHRIATLAGVALALSCGGGSDGTTPSPSDPAALFAAGPYRAGFVAGSVTYASPVTGEERTIPVRVWYPADDDALDELADYVLGDFSAFVGSALDGPAVSSDGPFPVAVYSHSSGSDGLLAYPYAEHFATHGWIFVAPNHVGNTALDRITDEETSRARSLAERPGDVSASLDFIETGAADIGLQGAAEVDGALVIGHSRGGTTALMVAGAELDVDALVDACEEDCEQYTDPPIAAALGSSRLDPRIGAVVTQAPASVLDFGEGELAAIEAPVMLMTGDLDMTAPDADAAWELLDGQDDVWIRLPNGGHLSFVTICADFGSLADIVVPADEDDGCGPGYIPPRAAVERVRGYALAFGLRHVVGESQWDDVLGPPPLDDEVEIVAR
jgi:predicted dienelactone hydrolase